MLKLFWCSTLDRRQDWFVLARDSEQACSFFASEMGYQTRQVRADFVVWLQRTSAHDSARWPGLALLASVGEAFLNGNAAATSRTIHAWSLDCCNVAEIDEA
jgi:hypothetical protein